MSKQYPYNKGQYTQQTAYDWQNAPVVWNPEGVYGGIKEEQPAGRWFLYIIPGVAAFLLVTGVLLPWLTMGALGINFSINGIGGVDGPKGLADTGSQFNSSSLTSTTPDSTSTAGSNTTQPFQFWHGWVLIGLAVLVLLFVLLGILQKTRIYSILAAILGLAGAGLLGYDFFNTSKFIDEVYKASTNPATNALLSIQVGYGLYLGAVASLVILIGSLITTFLYNKTGF